MGNFAWTMNGKTADNFPWTVNGKIIFLRTVNDKIAGNFCKPWKVKMNFSWTVNGKLFCELVTRPFPHLQMFSFIFVFLIKGFQHIIFCNYPPPCYIMVSPLLIILLPVTSIYTILGQFYVISTNQQLAFGGKILHT